MSPEERKARSAKLSGALEVYLEGQDFQGMRGGVMAKCKHKTYATNLSARKAAKELGLDPRRNVEKCEKCDRWKVMP